MHILLFISKEGPHKLENVLQITDQVNVKIQYMDTAYTLIIIVSIRAKFRIVTRANFMLTFKNLHYFTKYLKLNEGEEETSIVVN